LTIFGSLFRDGPLTCRFGDDGDETTATFVSETEITCRTPKLKKAGTIQVYVYMADVMYAPASVPLEVLESEGSNVVGIVVGVIFGVLAIVLAGVLITIFILRRKNRPPSLKPPNFKEIAFGSFLEPVYELTNEQKALLLQEFKPVSARSKRSIRVFSLLFFLTYFLRVFRFFRILRR
jgi:hypothetical protein